MVSAGMTAMGTSIGVGGQTVAMGLATIVGTASTGTAISTLLGAAATKFGTYKLIKRRKGGK